MDDDEFLFDDDLTDVPDNTLQDLELHALASTQRAKPALSQRPPTVKRQLGPTPGLNRAGSTNKNIPWRPPQPQKNVPVQRPGMPQASVPDPPSSDYGLDDEEVIDLDEPSMIIQPASGMASTTKHAPSLTGQRNGARPVLDPETEAAFAAADAELGAPAGQWSHAPHLRPTGNGHGNVTELEARIAQLEAEQVRLRQSEQEARNDALKNRGEIAIARSNQDKAIREYERKIAVIQKLHADESAKTKSELEASRKEREKMETDNRFLQHDLAQESERMKRLRGPGLARGTASGKEKETPRKAKRTNLGDGFEDDEVRLTSPSKSKDKLKDQSPRHGTKRKRSAQDSPGISLSFAQAPGIDRQESTKESSASFQSSDAIVATAQEDGRYNYMQRLLSFRSGPGQERALELLARHYFPSNSQKSLSSIFFDQLMTLNSNNEERDLAIKASRALLWLWRCCVSENYFEPLEAILDLLSFALAFELTDVVSELMEDALPICIRSIDLVAYPLTRASVKSESATHPDQMALKKIAQLVNVDDILAFVHQISQAATLSKERIEAFWQRMELTFVLQMLNAALSASQVSAFLQILATSISSTSFGPISPDAQTQVRQESALMERITSLLFEDCAVPEGEVPYSEEEKMEMQIENLKVFKALCMSDHGCLLLAQHRTAIGRLIRFLHGLLKKLYSVRPSSVISNTDEVGRSREHELIIEAINTTVRIVYHVLRTHDDIINIIDKLQVIHGGYHKFLISMTRIAFSEQLVFEHGIEDEVSEAAHMILDSVLSPEEGEAVVKAVETPMGTRGTNPRSAHTPGVATEKDTSLETTQIDGDATMSDV